LQTSGADAEFGAAMSPLEAFFFAVSLLQQKRYNVEFQLTNDEWTALHGGARARGSNGFRGEMEARRGDSSRGDQIEQAIETGFAAMSAAEMLGLPEQLLDTLGVER
jgi:hypothetical protein